MRTDKMQTAIVSDVREEGLLLQFPDGSEVSDKRYKYNKSVTFAVGDRVLLLPSGGSYVVAFPI